MITEHLLEPVLCAVSGGVDSMYMLCRLHEAGWQVEAAHFNHGLRGPEADRDEAFVRDFCRDRGIPFHGGRGEVSALAAREGLGVEDAARRLRYAFLEETADAVGAGCIATAHTAEDNAETMLFHLARGTGLRGLGGIPPQRGRIVRPILDETREQAERWLLERGIGHVEDSTNASDAYARNRIRHAVTPVMKEINSGFVMNAARTAELLRRDEEFLQGLAEAHIRAHGASASALVDLPEPIAARVLRKLTGADLSEVHVKALWHIARQGGAADIPGMRVRRVGDELVFADEEIPALPERELSEGTLVLPEAGLALRCESFWGEVPIHIEFNSFYFSRNDICGKINIGMRRPGDKMRPVGRGCTKSLKQLFAEMGVPAHKRAAWPVLRDEAGVIALYGLGVDERVSPRKGAQELLKISFVPLDRKEQEK